MKLPIIVCCGIALAMSCRDAAAQVFYQAKLLYQTTGVDDGILVNNTEREQFPVSTSAPKTTVSSGIGVLSIGPNTASVTISGSERPSEISEVESSYENQNFRLDPVEAGIVARISYNFQVTGSASSSGSTRSEAFASYRVGGDSGTVEFDSRKGVNTTTGTPTRQGTDIPVPFGSNFAISLDMDVVAKTIIFDGDIPGSASASGSASLTYSLVVLEDRKHWNENLNAIMESGNETQWVEFAEPGATQYAVFNKTTPRNITVTLDASRTWRGLIVDGESVNLDLSGKTLALGSSGSSAKTYSLLLGEGRTGASNLTLRNGALTFEKDIVVGGTSKNGGILTLDNGLVASSAAGTGNPSVLVGEKGNGSLTVKGASQLTTSTLVLAANDPATPGAPTIIGAVEITGAGSKITATLASIGERGEGALAIRNGGVLQAEGLKLGARTGSNGTLTVEGAGSKLLLTGGFADIGMLGRGSVEVKSGGLLDGSSTKISVGAGNAALFSVLRVKDAGSTMTDVGVFVNDGGLFEVRDGASWALNLPNFFSMNGGTTTFQNSTVSVFDAIMNGGILNVNSSATLEISSTFHQFAGSVNVNGTNARLFGFQGYLLNGTLTVANGGEIFSAPGGLLTLGEGANILGNGGTIHSSVMGLDGVIRPGESPGTLTIDGDLTLTGNSSIVLEIGGLTGGTQYDQLIVTGNLTLDGCNVVLAFINGFAPSAGQKFSFLDTGGTFVNTATLSVAGLEPGWDFATAFDAESGAFTLTSLNNGIAAVPEPSTWALILLAGTLLSVGFARRRLRRSTTSL